jgi:hypothetical protein
VVNEDIVEFSHANPWTSDEESAGWQMAQERYGESSWLREGMDSLVYRRSGGGAV